jgi:hypothetical protein
MVVHVIWVQKEAAVAVEVKMKKISFIFIALFIGLNMIANISALENNLGSCPMGGMMYSFNGSYGSGAMIFSWTISILLIILIITGIYWFIKNSNQKNNQR